MITDSLRMKMISAAALAGAIAFGALLAPPTARAGEYCSVDVDFMKNCSFSSLEQCQASVSGTDGDCSLNPYTKDTSIATIKRNAYAYAPLSTYGKRAQKGSAATKR